MVGSTRLLVSQTLVVKLPKSSAFGHLAHAQKAFGLGVVAFGLGPAT